MSYGTSTEPWSRQDASRRRRGRALLALGGVLSLAVIIVGSLVAAGAIRIPGLPGASGRSASPAASHTRKPKPPPARPKAGPIGSYQVASTALRLLDSSRPRLGVRVLPTLVRYPVVSASEVAAGKLTKGPFPLVVFAPGYLQCRESYAALLHSWASAGYVVAIVEFPRTTCGTAAPNEADVANQPSDLSVVITRLLGLSAKPSGVLAGLIDPAKIAVAGHSDGGDAAVAVAAGSCCADHRVGAAIILAGSEYGPFGSYFQTAAPPVLFVQGNADTWNAPAASTQLYTADTGSDRYYLDLFGYGHFAPYQGQSRPEPIVAQVGVDFLNRYLGGQAADPGAISADGNVSGVSELTSGGRLPG